MMFNMCRLAIVIISLFVLAGCGPSRMAVSEAEVIAVQQQREAYVPPPRGISGILEQINKAKSGYYCSECNVKYDPDADDLDQRLYNLSKLAIKTHFEGRTKQSKEYIEKAVPLVDMVAYDYKEKAILYNRLAMIAGEIGQYSESIRLINKAADMANLTSHPVSNTPLKGLLVGVYTKMANLYIEAGAIDDAESALSEAYSNYYGMKNPSKEAIRLEPYYQAQLSMADAKIAYVRGDLVSAEELLRLSIVKLENMLYDKKSFFLNNKIQVWGYYLVDTLLGLGRLSEAEAESRKAIEFSLDNFGRNTFATARTIQGLINVLMAKGQYDGALELSRVVRDIYKVIEVDKVSLSVAKVEQQVALIHMAMSNWEAASDTLYKLEKTLKNDPHAYDVFFGDNLYWSIVLIKNGEAARAIDVINEVVDARKDTYGGSHVKTLVALLVKAAANISTGNSSAGRNEFKTLLADLSDKFHQNSRDFELAVDKKAVEIAVEVYLDNLSTNNDSKSIDNAFFATQLIHAAGSRNQVSLGVISAKMDDPDLTSLVEKEKDLLRSIEATYNSISNVTGGSNGDSADFIKQAQLRAEKMIAARESILSEISSKYPRYSELVRPKPVSLSEISRTLSHNDKLIVVHSGVDKMFVFVVSKTGGTEFISVPLSAKKVAAAVNALRASLDIRVSRISEIPAFDVNQAHRLYDVIFARTSVSSDNGSNLIFVVDGALSKLPLSVLVKEKPRKLVRDGGNIFTEYRTVNWLGAENSISYVPSVNTYMQLVNSRKTQDIKLNKFVGFGAPIFAAGEGSKSSLTPANDDNVRVRGVRLTKKHVNLDSDVNKKSDLSLLSSLPDTSSELVEVAQTLGVPVEGNVFIESNASESNVKKTGISDREVIMFATHALLPGDLDGLTQPAIALSNPAVIKDEAEDGLLTMGEIMGLKVNANWVVLSACNTGSSEGRGSESVSGLGQAFFYSGARSMLVSHWSVETRSARLLTTGIFKHHEKSTGKSRSESLKHSMTTLLNNSGFTTRGGKFVSYAHPFFWAPFTIIGDASSSLQ